MPFLLTVTQPLRLPQTVLKPAKLEEGRLRLAQSPAQSKQGDFAEVRQTAPYSLGARIWAATRSLARALKGRREVSKLRELDDRMLQDLGVTREDIERSLAGRLTDNPSETLTKCRRENRAKRFW